MRTRSKDQPEKNIIKGSFTSSTTATPNLNLVNVFRYTTTDDLAIANPKNLTDGEYIRIEVVTVSGKNVEFGSKYYVNGAIIVAETHILDTLVIYEGWYNQDTDTINIISLISSSAVPANARLNADGSSRLDAEDNYILNATP